VKKISAFILLFFLLFPLYSQEQLSSKIDLRKATPPPPNGSFHFNFGSRILNCGEWELCKDNNEVSNMLFLDLGVDIFFPDSYWSIPINIINAKNNGFEDPSASIIDSDLVLETLDIFIGLRRHHFSNYKKYSALDFFYSVGGFFSFGYYYPGKSQPGFSFSQSSACDITIICRKGSGSGYYVDMGLQVSIKQAYNLGAYVSYSSAIYNLTSADFDDIENGDFGGAQFGFILGSTW
jgi:hypothetical protein